MNNIHKKIATLVFAVVFVGIALPVGAVVIVPPPPTYPMSKDDCKKYGWMTFTNPSFRNQGQCVSFVMANENANKIDKVQ